MNKKTSVKILTLGILMPIIFLLIELLSSGTLLEILLSQTFEPAPVIPGPQKNNSTTLFFYGFIIAAALWIALVWFFIRFYASFRSINLLGSVIRFLNGIVISCCLISSIIFLPGLGTVLFGLVMAFIMGLGAPNANELSTFLMVLLVFLGVLFMIATPLLMATAIFIEDTELKKSISNHFSSLFFIIGLFLPFSLLVFSKDKINVWRQEKTQLTERQTRQYWIDTEEEAKRQRIEFEKTRVANRTTFHLDINFIFTLNPDLTQIDQVAKCSWQTTERVEIDAACANVKYFYLYDFKKDASIPISIQRARSLRIAAKQLENAEGFYVRSCNGNPKFTENFANEETNRNVCLMRGNQWEKLNIDVPGPFDESPFRFVSWVYQEN